MLLNITAVFLHQKEKDSYSKFLNKKEVKKYLLSKWVKVKVLLTKISSGCLSNLVFLISSISPIFQFLQFSSKKSSCYFQTIYKNIKQFSIKIEIPRSSTSSIFVFFIVFSRLSRRCSLAPSERRGKRRAALRSARRSIKFKGIALIYISINIGTSRSRPFQ